MLRQGFEAAGVDGHAVAYNRLSVSTLGPGAVARLLAWLRRASLDRELIDGADPASSPQLAARSARLASARERTQLAEGVERLLGAARGDRRRCWALARGEHVRANEPQLAELAALLRSSTPLYARGLAIVYRLLTDGSGPAYRGSAEHLGSTLEDARTAMYGC